MTVKLDAYDLAILKTLQKDGRITKAALAAAVNLSPSPCWQRLRKLEDAGIITGYSAQVDHRSLRPVTEVIVEVTLANHRKSDFDAFEARMMDTREVIYCAATGGGIDYVLRLHVSSVEAYQDFMEDLLDSDAGIDRYFGYVVTKPIKSVPPPLDEL